jgi:hypothetical protein
MRRKVAVGGKAGHFGSVSHTACATAIVMTTPAWVHCHYVGWRNKALKERVSARDAGIEDADHWSIFSGGGHPSFEIVQPLGLFLGRGVDKECAAFLSFADFCKVIEYI